MARELFTKHLLEVEVELSKMCDLVVRAIVKSLEVMKSGNLDEARQIVQDDLLINKKRWEIEEKCIGLISTQQPVAKDLRILITFFNIISELERMGDHAKGIAKLIIKLSKHPLLNPVEDIGTMVEKCVAMTQKSLEAFRKRDIPMAEAVCQADHEVDELYDKVYHELLQHMIQDPTTIKSATYLLRVAHHLERIADRDTNICERIIFLVHGHVKETKDTNVTTY